MQAAWMMLLAIGLDRVKECGVVRLCSPSNSSGKRYSSSPASGKDSEYDGARSRVKMAHHLGLDQAVPQQLLHDFIKLSEFGTSVDPRILPDSVSNSEVPGLLRSQCCGGFKKCPNFTDVLVYLFCH